MSLLTTLNDNIKTVMKAKDEETLTVLRMLRIAIQSNQIKAGRESNGERELTVLSHEMKQRKDSLSKPGKAGHDDLIEKVEVEIAAVEKYMSQQLTEEEIRQLAREVTTRAGATSSENFGKVMDTMMPKIKGKADSSQVNAIVKELLQEN